MMINKIEKIDIFTFSLALQYGEYQLDEIPNISMITSLILKKI